MNDVTELKDGWGEPEPPSPAARATARAALMREIAAIRPPEPAPRLRGRRLGWLMGGTVVTAAAAVLAVVLSPVQPGQPGQAGRSGQSGPPGQAVQSPPIDELSGQQVLLLAAEVAQAQPESTGVYWHSAREMTFPDYPLEIFKNWITRDGVHYSMPHGDAGVSRIVVESGFPVGGQLLTLERVEGLPTDPDELKTWMADSYDRIEDPERRAGMVPFGLADLLWQVPAPPEVRSAALRALATLPNVTNLGAVDGGQALRAVFAPPPADKFPGGKLPPGAGELTVVINPDTATLVSYTTYQGTIRILAAGWRDDLPPILPNN